LVEDVLVFFEVDLVGFGGFEVVLEFVCLYEDG